MAPRSLFKDYGGGTRQRRRENEGKQMEHITLEYLAAMEQNSAFFPENPARAIASFDPSGKQHLLSLFYFHLLPGCSVN